MRVRALKNMGFLLADGNSEYHAPGEEFDLPENPALLSNLLDVRAVIVIEAPAAVVVKEPVKVEKPEAPKKGKSAK